MATIAEINSEIKFCESKIKYFEKQLEELSRVGLPIDYNFVKNNANSAREKIKQFNNKILNLKLARGKIEADK